MITEENAQKLISEYKFIKNNVTNSSSKAELKKLKYKESVLLQNLSYIVKTKISKYRKFNNYDDLYQEGMIVLLHAIDNYDQSKGSFFWWAHKYVGTKIFRSANGHSTIKIPLKKCKNTLPYKELVMPLLIEEVDVPDLNFDKKYQTELVNNSLNCLSDYQKQIISCIFGVNDTKQISIQKVCQDLNISRVECTKIVKEAIDKLKNNINCLESDIF